MQYIVVDLEANPSKDFLEVINIAAHKVNVEYKVFKDNNNYKITSDNVYANDQFNTYVKPIFNGRLSKKLSKMLDIQDEALENARLFDVELSNFHQWSNENNEDTIFVAWSKTDSAMIKSNCKKYYLNYRWFCNQYFDLQKSYDIKHNKKKPTGLSTALKENNYDFIGQPHKALDDSYNTTQLLLNC